MSFIEAKEVNLRIMLSNGQESYKVPLYQRAYAWTKDHWIDLFSDISGLSDKDIHFLGSVVVIPEGKHRLGLNAFWVVDGQQRLATILIWLSAIRDIARENEDTNLANHIENTYLFSKEWRDGKEVKIPKLQLSKQDNDAFLDVLKGNGKKENFEHTVYSCYDYFKKNTPNKDIWQKLLSNVSLVHINAFNHFNAFRLFETLNDRGLALSAVDLIKNFLLMNIADNQNFFDDVIYKWNEMYENVKENEPIKFIRRYVLSEYKGKVSESRLYDEVRKKLENKPPENLLDFISNLDNKSMIYKKICEAGFPQPRINMTLGDLHMIEVGPSYTLLLKIFAMDEISEADILQIMKMIEVFHVRWGICGQSTSQLDQIYNDICMGLSDIQNDEIISYIDNALVKEQRGKVDDEIFRRNFSARQFKSSEPRTKYILWKLSKPTGETLLNFGEIQTEHILPQTLSQEWKDYLIKETGKKEEEVVASWQEHLNRIGNLAIIKGEWNQSMSNRLFSKKQEDYAKSEFVLTNKLVNEEQWTFQEIDNRCDAMSELALQIWRWRAR